jgi:hypothetical protein
MKTIDTTEAEKKLYKIAMDIEAERMKSQPRLEPEEFSEEQYYKDLQESFNRNI